MLKLRILALISGLTIAGSTLFAVTAPAVKVADAWIRIPPPGAGTTAAYLALKNEDKQPLKIKSVTVAGASSAELHETSASKGGGMAMKHLAELEVAPGATTTFAPGGLHVMIFGMDAATLSEGKTVDLTFTLDDGRQIKTTLKARAQ